MFPSPWRRRLWWLFVLAAIVGLLFWLRPRRRPPELIAETRSETRPPVPIAAASPPRAPAAPDAVREPEAEAPIIDEVTAEKSEVCEGEDNLISVRAHAKDPRDNGYLRYFIAGQIGSQVPVKSYFRSATDPPRMIQVIGRNDKTTTVEVPNFQVRKCKAAHMVTISMRLLPNTPDEYQLSARIGDSDPRDRFVPVHFDWDFGDKMSERTDRPSVEHRFEQGDEDGLVSRFLISLEASDAKGRKVVGRLQANLPNSEFENLKYKGTLVLSYRMNPRFPELNGDGVVEQKIRIWHHQPYPVTLRRAVVIAQLKKNEGTLTPREADPVDLLGTSTVPSSGIEATIRFDAKVNEKVAMVDYTITGEAADGTPAVLRFSVMRPPDAPTRESALAVTDALLNAKILKARNVLNREFVTDEDLASLEQEGAFEGLKADPNFKPGAFGQPPDLAMKTRQGVGN